MKATDLMIGDWVYIPLVDKNVKIHIVSDDGSFGYEYNGVIYHDYTDKVEPIPLTAEILERNCKNILRWKGKGYDWTWYNEDDGYIELSSRAEGETCKDGFFVSANGGEYRLFTIHYVNELQHALRLCGIEKEIEL